MLMHSFTPFLLVRHSLSSQAHAKPPRNVLTPSRFADVVALVVMLLITTYSDRYQTRGIPVASVFCIGIVGWAILLGIKPDTALHARYFGCICVVVSVLLGSFSVTVLTLPPKDGWM